MKSYSAERGTCRAADETHRGICSRIRQGGNVAAGIEGVVSGGVSGQPFVWHEDRDLNTQVNVGRIERWLSFIAGAALTTYAIKRRTTASGSAALAGAGLMYRGAT